MIRAALAIAILALAAPAAHAAARTPWRLGHDGAGPALSAGEGEDVSVSLHCKAHAGRIEGMFLVDHAVADHLVGDVWADKAGRRAPWAVTVHAASGVNTVDIPGKANADQMNGGSEIDFSLPASAPVAQAFAATGVLKLSAYGETPKIPAAPATLAAKFVKNCSK